MTLTLLTLLAILGLVCSLPFNSLQQKTKNSRKDISFIVGGEDAQNGMIPYQVALYASGSFFCGGTLIGKQTVLTAAQCVHK